MQLTRNLEQFDIVEKQSSTLQEEYANVTVRHLTVNHFDAEQKVLLIFAESTFKRLS